MPNQYRPGQHDDNTYPSYERERGPSPNAGNDDRRNDWAYRTQPELSDEGRHRGSNESYGTGGSRSGEGYGGSSQSGGGQYGAPRGQYGGGHYGNENRYGSNYGGSGNDRYGGERWGNEGRFGAGYGSDTPRGREHEREVHRPERFGNAYGAGHNSYGEQHGGENRFASSYGREHGNQDNRGGSGQDRWNYDARFNQAPHATRPRGPHFGKGPQGFQRSDERIKEMVSESLADHDDLDATNIHVEVASGEVTLTGTVDSRHDKRAAEHCVEHVTGVKDVHNQLRVVDRSAPQPSSAKIQH